MMPDSQPMLGLTLEPTIAIHRNQSFVVQCGSCGALLTVPQHPGRTAPHKLDACPICSRTDWHAQHLPVGPYRAAWASYLVNAVHHLLTGPKSEEGERVENLRRAYERAIRSARETSPVDYERLHEGQA